MPEVNSGADRVMELLEQGVALGEALKRALTERDWKDADFSATTHGAISRLAARYALNRANTSSQLHGRRRATDDVLTALSDRLGGSPGIWFDLLRSARSRASA